MEKIYESYAPKYFEKGFCAIPLSYHGKNPVIKDWTNIKVYQDYEKIIEQYPTSNIGILLGESSGIIAVDIDKDSALSLVPLSPVIKKGKKGETRFFKYNGEQSRKRLDLGIEILSNGNQTVVPPSIHPETNQAYVWITPDTLFNIDKTDLPTLDEKFLTIISSVKQTNSITPSDGTRCNHGSHDKLSAMLTAAIHAGDSLATIEETLLSYDEQINPEISYFLCPGRKEWKVKDRVINCRKFINEGFERHLKVGSINKAPAKEPTFNLVDRKKEELVKMKLPKLSGIAQEMFEFIIANSSQERTHFAFPTAMMAVSTIIGNKIQFKGITPNLYSLVVGESGAGKTTSFNFIKDLMVCSPLGINLLGASTITSVNGITQVLKNYRVQISIIDEASSLFETINDKIGQGESVSATLSELYTSTGKIFSGKNVSHAKDIKNSKGNVGGCFSPYLNLLMGTTFEAFEKSFTPNLINRGFFGRGDIYFDYKNKRDKDRENLPMPQKFIDFLNMWRQVKNESLWEQKADSLDLDENAHLRPFVIPEAKLKQDAEELYKETIEQIRTIKEKSPKKDNMVIAMINRMEVLFVKYAIIIAASNTPDTTNIVITKKDLRFAYDLVRTNINNAKLIITEHMFEGNRKIYLQRIIDFIRDNNQATKSDITRKFRNYLNKKSRDEYISDLKESGIIVEKTENSTKFYVLV